MDKSDLSAAFNYGTGWGIILTPLFILAVYYVGILIGGYSSINSLLLAIIVNGFYGGYYIMRSINQVRIPSEVRNG